MERAFDSLFAASFHEMADIAGEVALKYFRQNVTVEVKADETPVTIADREIEEKLHAYIRAKFPSHGIIGEEFGQDNAGAEFVWVIDPIDGTKSFISGIPLFGTVIGLLYQGKPVVGLVEQAFTHERWFGVSDQFCQFNGNFVRVAQPCALKEARCCTYLLEKQEEQTNQTNVRALRNAVRTIRYNMDCYPYALLSMGCVDLVVENGLNFYDIAGVIPLIKGSGGFVSDWNERPIGQVFDGTIIAASTHALAVEALELIKNPAF